MTGLPDAPDSSAARDANVREFHREQLSAMMDGALSTDETRFLLRRMEHDDALADCWERWQFLGDALRGHAGRALPADFSRRVGRAIADDLAAGHQQQVAAVASGSRRPLLRWGGGAALAASVALAALIGTRDLSSPDGDTPAAVASTSLPTPVTIPMPTVPGVAPAPLSSPVPQPSISEAGTVVAAATIAATAGNRRTVRPRILASAQAIPASATVAGNAAAAALQASTGPDDLAAVQTGVTPKPWPRALVPGASVGGSVNAGYAGVEGLELHALQSQPAQPQLQAFPRTRRQPSESSNEGASSPP